MTSGSRPAPIADWVQIPDLYRDPFPIFERLRAEGGVHWVPAVNRYLVTSFAAVHDTELDQETFSANEEGSLMIRAMGHSMLRRDDPDHYVERRAWQPVLRPGVVKKTWMPIFERNAQKHLDAFLDMGPGRDLVWDFAAPYVSENLRAVIGLHNATQQDLQRWSQTMIDATGNYADDPVVWAKGQASYDEVDAALDEMLAWHRKQSDDSLISALLALPDYQMPIEAIRANLKMTIGGGLNEPRDAIGVAAYSLLADPAQLELVTSGKLSWDAVFDESIRWVAPIGMYSRQTTRDVTLQGVELPAGSKLGICILSANRDENQWAEPAAFNAAREGEGAHLAFGKGVHVCLGAWIARAEVAAVALPKLFTTLPDLRTVADRPPQMGGWVFRGMTQFPVDWTAPQESTAESPVCIAVVGAGPSGCYSAQALRREFADAEIVIFDKMPTPYGLLRYGVAADHQGTKAISKQFARLFEKDGVEFVGGVEIGSDISLDALRGAFNAVVIANGLHADAPLTVPNGNLPSVHGAGRITRLLNGHPGELRPAPQLGETVAIVGHGNVSMDLVRLLAKTSELLADSDIDDEAHATLVAGLRTIHVVGRSQPASAKFDPVMLREIIDLPDVEHVIHGVDLDELVAADDPRSAVVRELTERQPASGTRVRIEWWFGYAPLEVAGQVSAEALVLAQLDNDAPVSVPTSSIITAIGFAAADGQELVAPSPEARETGRVEEGLYVAGWARRGPRGTIPSQRTDSRELVSVIAADLAERSARPGIRALRGALSRSSTYEGWLLIDAHETRNAAPGRIRGKVSDLATLRLIAGAALNIPRADDPEDRSSAATGDRQRVTVAFGTESGNAELVAEELRAALAATNDVTVIDLAQATIDDIPRGDILLLVCSTYGDGELPTNVRRFHSALVDGAPDLSGLRYAVFGLGDHSYTETYSRGSEILDEAFTAAGAKRVGEYGRHDAGGRDLAPALAVSWATDLIHSHATRVTATTVSASE